MSVPFGPDSLRAISRRHHGGLILSFFTLAAVWLVVLWGANRSFDFTDEGAYYLSAVHPQEVPDRQTTYFLFGRALFALCAHNVIVTRALMAGLLLASTLTLVRGLRRFLGVFAPALAGGTWLSIAAIAGSALAFSTSPVAPSYNLLNAVCLLAITGWAMEGTSSSAGGRFLPPSSGWGPALGAGVLLVADFFIKFSTSVALAAILALFFLTTNRARMRQKAGWLLAILFLGLLAGAGYILSVQSLAAWRDGVGGTWRSLSGGGYLESELARYAGEFRVQTIETLWNYETMFTALLWAGGALLLLRRQPAAQRWIALLAAIIVLGLAAQAAPAALLHQTGRSAARFYLAVICALAMAGSLTWLVRPPGARPLLQAGGWRILPLLALLAALPFVGSFGTSNDINDNTIYQFAPWLILIALLLAWLAHAWQARWLPGLGVLLVSTVAFSQFASGYIRNPYRVPGGRLAQVVPTAIGYPATILRLDPASHEFVNGVRTQLEGNGYKPGDDIFAFFNLPGLVFALGGVSPGHPWYFTGDENSLALDEMRVAGVAPARRARAFIVRCGESSGFMARLRTLGIDFPNDYERCGPALRNPLTGESVEVWKPKARK